MVIKLRITGPDGLKPDEALSSSEVPLLSSRGGMSKKYFSRLNGATDIGEAVKAKTCTKEEFYHPVHSWLPIRPEPEP